jgi:hypothetical protein
VTKTCKATRVNGQPCQAPAGEDGYCFGHSPRLSEARRAGSSRGGRNKRSERRAEKLMPEVLKPVLYNLLSTMAALDDGRVPPRVASAKANLAVSIIKVYEVASLEGRLLALEQELTKGTGHDARAS